MLRDLLPCCQELILYCLFFTPFSQLNRSPSLILSKLIPDFGSSSGKSRIRPFFENPAKSNSGQISSRIWWMLVQLLYVQLIADTMNVADLSSGVVFTILVSITWAKNIQN